MARMVGQVVYPCCPYGCCKDRSHAAVRLTKRRERQAWKKEVRYVHE